MELSEVNANPVRVSMPASVAAEIGSFKKAVGSVLDKLGCGACCSGHDIHFELQRGLVFRRVEDAGIPISSRSGIVEYASKNVNQVGIQPQTAMKIENVFSAIDRIADIMGCQACCSGHDLRLQMEHNFVLDSSLEIDEPVLRFG